MRQFHPPAIRSVAIVGALAFVLGGALVGCGSSSSAPEGAVTAPTATATMLPTVTPTTAPTATIPPTSTTTANGAITEHPGCSPDGRSSTQFVTVGVLRISRPQRAMDYPSDLIPSSQPNSPFKVQPNGTYPLVNPSLYGDSGYAVEVCNPTSTPHTLSSVSVSIANFSPNSGTVNEFSTCGNFFDAKLWTTTGGGCGGAFIVDGWLEATLPSDSTGASAAATVPADATRGENPPITIAPNSSVSLAIEVVGFNSQGTYSLSVDVSTDGGNATALTPVDGAVFMAPHAVRWSGSACETSAMEAQIPHATQDVEYVCP